MYYQIYQTISPAGVKLQHNSGEFCCNLRLERFVSPTRTRQHEQFNNNKHSFRYIIVSYDLESCEIVCIASVCIWAWYKSFLSNKASTCDLLCLLSVFTAFEYFRHQTTMLTVVECSDRLNFRMVIDYMYCEAARVALLNQCRLAFVASSYKFNERRLSRRRSPWNIWEQ